MACVVHLLDGSTVVSDHDVPSVRAQLRSVPRAAMSAVPLIQISTADGDEDYVTINPVYVTVIAPIPEPQEATA